MIENEMIEMTFNMIEVRFFVTTTNTSDRRQLWLGLGLIEMIEPGPIEMIKMIKMVNVIKTDS